MSALDPQPAPVSRGWREEGFYAALAAAGRPALAWEVLRRDPRYRAIAGATGLGQAARRAGLRVLPLSARAAETFGLLFRS